MCGLGSSPSMAAGVAPGAVAVARAQATSTAPASAARPVVDAARGQTIDELVALALRQSPDAAAVRTRVTMARSEFDQAGNRPNPSLSFEQREQVSGTDRQTSIGLAWPLDLSRRSGRTSVAERSVDVASAEVADRERRLATDVRSLAARLLGAVRQLQVREEVVEAKSADRRADCRARGDRRRAGGRSRRRAHRGADGGGRGPPDARRRRGRRLGPAVGRGPGAGRAAPAAPVAGRTRAGLGAGCRRGTADRRARAAGAHGSSGLPARRGGHCARDGAAGSVPA